MKFFVFGSGRNGWIVAQTVEILKGRVKFDVHVTEGLCVQNCKENSSLHQIVEQ